MRRTNGRWMVMAALILGTATSVATANPPRLAVVDMETLMRLHPNTVSDKKLLEETLRDFEDQGDRAREDVDALKLDFERAERHAQSAALSEAARTRAAQSAVTARETWQQAHREWMEQMQQLQQQLTDQEMRMLRRTLNELRDLISAYSKENGYDLVFDRSGQRMGSMPLVIHHDSTLDITDALLERMNVSRPRNTPEPNSLEPAGMLVPDDN